MEFYDFDVEIGLGNARDYPVKVHSPTGEPSGTMRFPFDTLELKSHLQAVEIALLRSGATRRDIASEEARAVQDFGHQLFDALLNNRVREGFRRSRDRAHSEGKGLRVRLRIEAPELACLPWEFLYDAEEGDYVCLSADTPIIRYIELARPTQSLAVEPPLRVLGMIASPNDRIPLKVENERQRIEAGLKGLTEAGLIQLTWLEGQGWRHLQRAMRQGVYHVFHFVGHGGFDANSGQGLIALVDESGGTHRLLATDLGRLLVGHRSLRLVVLNSCEGARGSKLDIFSSTASILIRRGVPAVLSMQYEITDAAAVEFARGLYEALADEIPVDVAVAEARKSISFSVPHTVEWGTPVLHMRSPDGVLFRIDRLPPSGARGKGVHAPVAEPAISPHRIPDQESPQVLLPPPQRQPAVEGDSEPSAPGELQRPIIAFAPSLLRSWELALAEGHWEGRIPCHDEVLLAELREVLRDVLTQAAMSKPCISDVEVGLTELCRNVARHAATPIGDVSIDIDYKYRSAAISVSSEGPAFTLKSALLKHQVPAGQQRSHVVHGLYNMLTRGSISVKHSDGFNVVRFYCGLQPERAETPDTMRLQYLRGDYTAGDVTFSPAMWFTLMFGILPDDPNFVAPTVAPNFDAAREMLMRQWDAPLPVGLSIELKLPGWTLSGVEMFATHLFDALVYALRKDKRFRLLDTPYVRELFPGFWEGHYLRALAWLWRWRHRHRRHGSPPSVPAGAGGASHGGTQRT